MITLPWNGASMFAPDRAEYLDMMRQAQREEAKQRAMWRTVKRVEIALPVTGSPTHIFTDGPSEGYIWNVKLFSATLTGADTGQVYKASSDSTSLTAGDRQRSRLFGSWASTTFPVITWSSSQFYLKHGEGLYIETSGAFRFTNYFIAAEESSAEREAVIYD